MAYVTEADLKTYGMCGEAIDEFSPDEKSAAMLAADSEFEMCVGSSYVVPMTGVPLGARMHIARAAVFHMFSTKGMSLSGSDDLLDKNYERALNFYKQVRTGAQVLTKSQTGSPRIEVPDADSGCERGWDRTSGV